MKILILSLLRTGDLFMHDMLFKQLKEQNPDCELHVLVNDLNKHSAQQLKYLDEVHILNRSYLQKYLVEENRPWIRSYQNLRLLIKELNSEKFDRIYNFTHTFFSARLMDVLQAKSKMGAQFAEGRVIEEQNSWNSYLNLQFSLMNQSHFHYIDVLAKNFDIQSVGIQKQRVNLDQNLICLQVLTSDQKKNWPLQKFKDLALKLKNKYPQFEIVILGAPNEKDRIENTFATTDGFQLQFPVWSELKSVLKKTRLLITGDTSVQHYAVSCQVPVLSLFMGSANPQKTGPYQKDAIILQGKVTCTPCSHSMKCSQKSQICAEEIAVDHVYSSVQFILEKTLIPKLSCRFFQVTENQSQYFISELNTEDNMKNINSSFEQIIWKIYLDGGFNQFTAPFGTSALQFFESNISLEQSATFQEWLNSKLLLNKNDIQFIDQFEKKVFQSVSQENFDGKYFQNLLTDYLAGNPQRTEYFFALSDALSQVADFFPMLRKIKKCLNESRTLLQIENKFIHTLLSEKKERGQRYVSGIRKLSEASLT